MNENRDLQLRQIDPGAHTWSTTESKEAERLQRFLRSIKKKKKKNQLEVRNKK